MGCCDKVAIELLWVALEWSHIQRVQFFATHATCPITFMGVEYNELQMVMAIQKIYL
jgi:hypothetical protein